MARAGFDPASYAGRSLLNVLESYPRDELFQIDEETLYRFALAILNLSERPRIRALARPDEFDRFVSVLVFIPKDRYDTSVRRRVGEFLASVYQGRLSAAYPAYPEGPLARTHFIIGPDEGETPRSTRRSLKRASPASCGPGAMRYARRSMKRSAASAPARSRRATPTPSRPPTGRRSARAQAITDIETLEASPRHARARSISTAARATCDAACTLRFFPWRIAAALRARAAA